MSKMTKNYKTQKKKTTTTVILNILFKTLVILAITIFAYIIYDKADFSTNKIAFTPKKDNKTSSNAPSELNWFNDFKGIENNPSKKTKKDSDSNENRFRYEGFKK